jgi:hypothetical protein
MTNSQTDSGKFRTALCRAGWLGHNAHIFSDPRKNTRRLKLWFADSVFNAPRKQQVVLEKALKELFGARYLTGYFIKAMPWGGKSLCIRLAKK